MSLALVRKAAALGLTLTLALAGVASADTIGADGDALATGNQSSIDLGAVPAGASRPVSVDLVLECRNSHHLPAGATLSIGASSLSIPANGQLTVTPATLIVPLDWPATGEACDGQSPAPSASPAVLELVAPTVLGAQTFDVIFASPDEEAVSNTPAFTVRMLVIEPPDTTDPVLHDIPAAINTTTTGSSATVSWVDPTATDDTDPAPVVTCAPQSGSAFGLGVTTVTCTAMDQAGNDASASFTVTVTQVTTLRGSWLRPLEPTVPALVGRAGRTVPLKLVVTDDGVAQGAGAISAPTLRLERLDACTLDAPATTSIALGSLAWADGAWQRNLDTGGLGTGCLRVVASVDGVDVASAVIQLLPEATSLKTRR
jgi:HYR domain